MPSTYYNVVITALTGGSEGDGFIDNKRIEHYMADGSTPGTKAQSQAKERGNIRYETIVNKLGLMGNLYISNVVASGATANAAATQFSFTVQSEHGDDCLVTSNELIANTVLIGNAAIKRSVARALIIDRQDFGDYYDPTTANAVTNDGTVKAAVRMGTRIEKVTAANVAVSIAAAEAAITVTKI